MTNNRPKSILLFSIGMVLCALVLQGCATSTHQSRTHVSLNQGANWHNAELTVAPVDAKIYELTASGALEERPDWSEKSRTVIGEAAKEKLQEMFAMDAVPWLTLSASEQKVLEEHIALYNVLSSAQGIKAISTEWDKRFDQQDMCLGPGLAFLSYKSEADIMVVFVGRQAKSTGGRIAVMVMAAAAGVVMPTGQSHLEVAAIELSTGNVLWRNAAISPSYDLLDRSGVDGMIAKVLKDFGELTR